MVEQIIIERILGVVVGMIIGFVLGATYSHKTTYKENKGVGK